MANFRLGRKICFSLPLVLISVLGYLLLLLLVTTPYTRPVQGPPEDSLVQFIYVYDTLGYNFTHDLLNKPHYFYSRQYAAEEYIYDMLVTDTTTVTMDPDKATLFYVPYFPTHHLFVELPPVENHIEPALQNVAKAWAKMLTTIKTAYPYFNRTNGRDHFSVFTMDHGRCSVLPYTDPSDYGEMFFMQTNGDILIRSTHAHTSVGIWALTYNWGKEPAFSPDIPDIPCYIPGRDIVLPPLGDKDELKSPFARRYIDVLLRFGPGHHHGINIPYAGHHVRHELLKLYKKKNITRWDIQMRWDHAWGRSKFCVAPPGHSQWTSRPVKSILAGCIPVVIESQHDRPWEDVLDYSKFSILIEIVDFHTVKERIDAVLKTPGRLKQMQRELQRVQNYFSWEAGLPGGAREQVIRVLRTRARQLRIPKANE